jgi:aspartate oxidase
MATLGDIERLTKEYAEFRNSLSAKVQTLEDEINAAKRRHMAAIKKTVATVMERRSRLKSAIEESPELFRKPRTMIIHGIKVGFQKAKGEIRWVDAAQVVKLVKKHFPELAETLIKTTETPVKAALGQIPAADLKRIGVTIEDDGDVVIIKGTDSEVDKFVEALLKDDDRNEMNTEAA